MPLNKGRKFGRELVRAISDPLDGAIWCRTVVAIGPNQWLQFTVASLPIEGMTVKALDGNASDVWICGPGQDPLGFERFPLQAGQALILTIDDLSKVSIMAQTGDGVAVACVRQAVD